MMEFTLSRAAICVCGVIILVSVTGVLNGIYEMDESEEHDRLVQRIGYMLDAF